MSYRQIKAYVRKDIKESLITNLKEAGVSGFNFYKIKGQGEMELAGSVETIKSYCFEIFSNTAQVDKIKKIIIQTAQTGEMGDGLISVSPVEEVIRIRDCAAKNFVETNI